MKQARPFLKWAGGKSQLLTTFRRFYPPELTSGGIRTYVEPFLGSGAVFFDVVQNYRITSALLGDINEELVLCYRVIQKDVHVFMDVLHGYKTNYLRRGPDRRKAYFYEIRSAYNRKRHTIDHSRYSESWVQRAAQLVFLNKTCYNGLFRMNSKGEFNTPAGSCGNPSIYDEENLLRVAELLQIAEIRRLHFAELGRAVGQHTFVYFDPPYRPLTKSANFTAYSTFQFQDRQQIELATLYRKLAGREARLMLSNSDPRNADPEDDFFDRLYRDFFLHRVTAKRMINSDKTKRGRVREILVLNYRVSQKTDDA